MGEFPNEIILDHTKQIAELKTDMKGVKSRLEDLSDIKEAVIKLTVLQEKQTEFSQEVSETLKVMNAEITETKNEVKNTNDKVNGLENKFEEKIHEIDNKSKIDLLELTKQYAVPAIMGGSIVYFILKVVGMI
jgi:predicted nuclease with TOPRIM domain